MVERHREMTGSQRAEQILHRWEHFPPLYEEVAPHPTGAVAQPQDTRALEAAALAAVTQEAHARQGAHSH
jgi:hypothetical protein